MTDAAAWASKQLNYRFSNHGLLHQALTHRSAGGAQNERLEFLGDAVLGLVVARRLYDLKPDAQEGELSRYRACLVRRETLAALARELDLASQVNLGPGEMRSGGHQRASVLADALEAVFGAIFLDSDFPTVQGVVLRLFESRIETLPPAEQLIDAKTALQELLQARSLSPPDYELLEVSGAAHAQTFSVRCVVTGLGAVTAGTGSSRRKAEQAAAAKMLEQLQDDG